MTTQLNGTKWQVENHVGVQDVKVTPENQKQSVYVYKCNESVITISGKCSSIAIDTCEKTGIIFDDVIASVEVVNSKGVQLQANGSVPNMTIDGTEGATIYVQTEAGRAVEIVTSNSRQVNIVTPGATEQDDPTEYPVPEQFLSKFESGKLVSSAVEHIGV